MVYRSLFFSVEFDLPYLPKGGGLLSEHQHRRFGISAVCDLPKALKARIGWGCFKYGGVLEFK